MAYRRKTTRKASPVRRRRRMGAVTRSTVTAAGKSAVFAAIGGAIAQTATKLVEKQFPMAAPYTGLAGAVVTSLYLKQPEIAAGMAGVGGANVAAALLGGGMGLAGDYSVAPSMYLQGSGENIYASSYSLAGYEVPGL